MTKEELKEQKRIETEARQGAYEARLVVLTDLLMEHLDKGMVRGEGTIHSMLDQQMQKELYTTNDRLDDFMAMLGSDGSMWLSNKDG